ncbi:MAG: tocopherol cyclase family protein, partial [Christensenellales bacterium]
MGHRLLPRHPALYHGKETSRPYFEGWYFKQVSKSASFSVIPGVFRGDSREEDIAFIQVIFGNPVESYFIRYPYSKFQYEKNIFAIWIGDSFFSMEKVILNITDIGLEGELIFSLPITLKTSVFSPTIMGPFSYLPVMQCNHGVMSLRHNVSGLISFNGNQLLFDKADGYIEKDWGEAFPESWIWMQCSNKETAMMCAIASIPYSIFRFTGLICVLLADGVQYRFATYNGAKILSVSTSEHKVDVLIKRRHYRLEISTCNDIFGNLMAPSKTGMDRVITESICAKYHVSLFYKKNTVFNQSYENGGLEMLN